MYSTTHLAIGLQEAMQLDGMSLYDLMLALTFADAGNGEADRVIGLFPALYDRILLGDNTADIARMSGGNWSKVLGLALYWKLEQMMQEGMFEG